MSIERKCKRCEADISYKRATAIYCSVYCCQENWRLKNKEKLKAYYKAYNAQYRINNREKIREYMKIYNNLT